jgi:hypothetical protein
MGKLVLRLPDGGTRDIPLERERTTIGRRPDNDVCLPYPAVSGEHAAVVTILDDSFLEDLNSTNGTLVNGKAVTKHFLRDRDEIDVGRQILVYYSGSFSSESDAGAGAPIVTRHGDAAADRLANPLHEGSERGEGTLPLQPMVPAIGSDGAIDTVAWFDAQRGRATPASPAAASERVPGDAPTLEVLDGPGAGRQVIVSGDEFVIGRIGVAIAAMRRTPDGFRLVHVEGDVHPRINGATLPEEGSLLALGDELEVAGTRLVYRPAIGTR